MQEYPRCSAGRWMSLISKWKIVFCQPRLYQKCTFLTAVGELHLFLSPNTIHRNCQSTLRPLQPATPHSTRSASMKDCKSDRCPVVERSTYGYVFSPIFGARGIVHTILFFIPTCEEKSTWNPSPFATRILVDLISGR